MDTNAERKLLRQQLQTHRRLLISLANPTSTAGPDAFPRSITMRMLTGKSTLFMLLFAEALPLLLARYLARSSARAREQ